MAFLSKIFGAIRDFSKRLFLNNRDSNKVEPPKEDVCQKTEVKEEGAQVKEVFSQKKDPLKNLIRIEPKKWEYNGESKTVAEWAKHFGVSETSIRKRIKRYGTVQVPQDSLESCANFKEIRLVRTGDSVQIEADGEIFSIQGFAKKIGMNFNTLYGRIQKGLDIKECIRKVNPSNRDYKDSAPVKARLWEWNGEKHTVEEWAKIYGIKKAMMRIRLTKHGSPERNTDRLKEYNENRSKKVYWNGDSHTIKEWAEIYKVPESTMRGRFAKYNSPEHHENKYFPEQAKMWEWNGESHTAWEWAKILGKSESSVRRCLRIHGIPVPEKNQEHVQVNEKEKSVTDEVIIDESDSDFYGCDGEWKTLSMWSEEYGLPIKTVKRNFQLYGEPTKPAFLPESSIFKTTSNEEDCEDIMRQLDELQENSCPKKVESIKEIVEKIKKETDDGQPLSKILGLADQRRNTLDGIIPKYSI